MAKRYWFKWNGTRSDTKNIEINEAPQIIRPEERIEHITIPGRSGDMTLLEGEDIYQSYIQSLSIRVKGASNVPAVESWLRGAGTLTLSSQSGMEQNARVIGAVQLSRHSWNADWWEGDVQFYCDPVKHAVGEEDITVTTSGTTVNNPGDMTAFPKIAITGSGAVTVTAGGKTLTIPECTSGWVIDSENEWILSGNTPQSNVCSGDFPVLAKGANTVTFTGSITKLVITPNFRYL